MQDKVARVSDAAAGGLSAPGGPPGTCWRVGGPVRRQRASCVSPTHGSNQARVVDVVYHAAGATAIFESEGRPGASGMFTP